MNSENVLYTVQAPLSNAQLIIHLPSGLVRDLRVKDKTSFRPQF